MIKESIRKFRLGELSSYQTAVLLGQLIEENGRLVKHNEYLSDFNCKLKDSITPWVDENVELKKQLKELTKENEELKEYCDYKINHTEQLNKQLLYWMNKCDELKQQLEKQKGGE